MKTKTFLLVVSLFIAAGLFLSGCKKEGSGSGSIVGKYILVSGGIPSYKYFQITADSLYIMGEATDYGRRFLSARKLTITSDSLYMYSIGYPYTLINGDLTITGLTPDPIIASKNTNVPDQNEWVLPTVVTNLGTITDPSSGGFNDMTGYGGSVVTDGHTNGTKYVFKQLTISTNSYSATEIDVDPSYISQVGYEDNIEYMNGKFLVYEWGNPNSYIYKVNPSDGMVESSVQVTYPVGNIYAIANDGVDLWGMTYDGIRKYDFINNEWNGEFAIGGAGALAGKGGYLYINSQYDNGIIQKYDPTKYKVVAAYQFPENYDIRGMAFVGNDIIASVYNYTTTTYQLIRIQL